MSELISNLETLGDEPARTTSAIAPAAATSCGGGRR
jgi:hypothetical protein